MMLHRWVFVGILEAFVGQGLEQFARHHEVVRGCCETDTVSWHKASSKRQHGCQNFGVPPEWNNTYNTRTISNGWRLCLYEMKSLRLRLCFWLRCDVIWYSVNQFDTDCLMAIDRHAHLQHDRIWYMILKPVSMHKFINIYIYTLCVCVCACYIVPANPHDEVSSKNWMSKHPASAAPGYGPLGLKSRALMGLFLWVDLDNPPKNMDITSRICRNAG